jgi:hypothetical protein
LPTLSPDLTGGIEGIPDPRITNPELFDLTSQDAPIPQFVNAMKMAGIEVTGEQVAQAINFQELKDKDGNPFIVATYNLDPDPSQTGETLEGSIPIMIAQKNKNGECWWEKARFKNISPLPFGGMVEKYPGINEIMKEFNFGTIASTWGGNIASGGVDKPLDFSKYEDFQINYANSVIIDLELLGGKYYFNSIIFPQYAPHGFENLSRDEAIDYLRSYITQVMSHFSKKGVRAFSVINEPYHPAGERNDLLLKVIGPDYVEIAFTIAKEIDPYAVLILNETSNHDYRQWGGAYTQQTRKITQNLYAKGLIDFVGVQGHFAYNQEYPYPSIQDLIEIFRSYKVPLIITEADVNLSAVEGSQEERYLFQADGYYKLVSACIKSGVCTAISLFGAFPDKNSWYEKTQNQPNADATPWDDSSNPKPAYYAILMALYEGLLGDNM